MIGEPPGAEGGRRPPDSAAVSPRLPRRTILWLSLVGGCGSLMMFYWAGAHSIPWRYAIYPALLNSGATDAHIAVAFVTVLLVGVLHFLWETGLRCVRAWHDFAPGEKGVAAPKERLARRLDPEKRSTHAPIPGYALCTGLVAKKLDNGGGGQCQHRAEPSTGGGPQKTYFTEVFSHAFSHRKKDG
jgi:hypothetical protein